MYSDCIENYGAMDKALKDSNIDFALYAAQTLIKGDTATDIGYWTMLFETF